MTGIWTNRGEGWELDAPQEFDDETRYDKLARRFMAFLHFASALIWLKRNVNETWITS